MFFQNRIHIWGWAGDYLGAYRHHTYVTSTKHLRCPDPPPLPPMSTYFSTFSYFYNFTIQISTDLPPPSICVDMYGPVSYRKQATVYHQSYSSAYFSVDRSFIVFIKKIERCCLLTLEERKFMIKESVNYQCWRANVLTKVSYLFN